MAKYIGRQIQVGFGLESVRGTAVSAGSWIGKTDLSFKDMSETIQDESSIGVIADSRNSFVIKQSGSGDIAGNVEVNSFGYILASLLGSVSTAAASTGAYEHTFNLSNTNTTQSLSICVKDPVEGDTVYPLSVIDSMTINAEEGGFVTWTATFMSKKGSSATHTATYTTDYNLLARHSMFKVATNLAGLDAASGICFQSFELTISKNVEADYCAGSIEPRDFVNKQVSIEGSFTSVYEAETFKNYQLDGTKKAIRFEIVDTNTTIGLTDNPTVSFDLPLVAFTEWDKTQGNDELVTQTLTMKGLYSYTDDSMIEAVIVNTKSSY